MCTRTRSPLLRFRESSTPPLLVDGSAISSCAKRKGQGWGSMLKTCRSRPSHEASRISLSQVWRHSCRTQTRYIARGCPLLDVIGQPLTSTTDGKFIGRWLPVLEPLSMVCKLAANEMSAGISRLNIFITVTVGCANYFLLTFE